MLLYRTGGPAGIRTSTAAWNLALLVLGVIWCAGCGTGPAGEAAITFPPEVAQHCESLNSEAASIRLAAVKALAQVELPESVDALLPVLDDPDESVRRWTVWALGRKNDLRATVAIIGSLEDSDANVRCAAVSALGSVRNQKVVGHIANRLADPSTAVQLAAGDQLAQHVPEELLRPEAWRIVPLAMRLLDSPNPALSRNAVIIMGRVSDQSYGAGLDWLDTSIQGRREVVAQWRNWYAAWAPERREAQRPATN